MALKVASFQKVQCVCQISKTNIPNPDPELETTVNNLFKFQAQDSDLEYLFWRFKKRITLSEKKTSSETDGYL